MVKNIALAYKKSYVACARRNSTNDNNCARRLQNLHHSHLYLWKSAKKEQAVATSRCHLTRKGRPLVDLLVHWLIIRLIVAHLLIREPPRRGKVIVCYDREGEFWAVSSTRLYFVESSKGYSNVLAPHK